MEHNTEIRGWAEWLEEEPRIVQADSGDVRLTLWRRSVRPVHVEGERGLYRLEGVEGTEVVRTGGLRYNGILAAFTAIKAVLRESIRMAEDAGKRPRSPYP